MAYFTLHAYDADVWLSQFMGLQQAEEMNGDIRYASEEYNLETPYGVLQPQAAPRFLPGSFAGRVETIARFYRRWYEGVGSKSWFVCCVGGHFYYWQEGSEVDWIEIPLPSGVTAFNSSVWSWVTYEENVQGVDHPVDILILSNAEDGMIEISPPDRPSIWADIAEMTWGDLAEMTWEEVYSPGWSIRRVTTPKKFGIIERYAERIWGGAIPEDPDMLMYSAPYDPTDWDANTEIPEDGAGSIQQPTWDGDSFTSLKAFGDQLIAFKEHRVWRVYGTNPGEYTFSQQFGGGAPFFNTIAVDVEKIFMADMNGPAVYDGSRVTPYARDYIVKIWRTVNQAALSQMCAIIWQDRYYLAFPTGDSTVNNALLVFDQREKTILLYKDIYIESMISTPDVLYMTSSSLPGRILEMRYDSWVVGEGTGRKTRWVSPWMDFGYKRIVKGGFDLYFTPEVQEEAVTLTISIQTEKKTKTKHYTVNPLTEREREAEKEHRYKRLHFGGTGRKFRVIIETEEGITAPWRLVGGLHLVVETDPD